ncbi:hypothetical protein PMAYCL1PPCAC_00624, partial [Pristionchus mayeri]
LHTTSRAPITYIQIVIPKLAVSFPHLPPPLLLLRLHSHIRPFVAHPKHAEFPLLLPAKHTRNCRREQLLIRLQCLLGRNSQQPPFILQDGGCPEYISAECLRIEHIVDRFEDQNIVID